MRAATLAGVANGADGLFVEVTGINLDIDTVATLVAEASGASDAARRYRVSLE